MCDGAQNENVKLFHCFCSWVFAVGFFFCFFCETTVVCRCDWWIPFSLLLFTFIHCYYSLLLASDTFFLNGFVGFSLKVEFIYLSRAYDDRIHISEPIETKCNRNFLYIILLYFEKVDWQTAYKNHTRRNVYKKLVFHACVYAVGARLITFYETETKQKKTDDILNGLRNMFQSVSMPLYASSNLYEKHQITTLEKV